MRTSARNEWGQITVVAAMFALALATFPSAPDRVPVRWNLQGDPVGYGGPVLGLFLLPVIAAGLYLGLRFVPLIDPGRANYTTFAAAYTFVRWLALLFVAGIYALIHLALRGVPVNIGTIAPLATGVMLIALGNVMGKLRPNWFIGIRTPWTLSSKRSWTRTHAIGGRVFVIIGLAFVLAPVGQVAGLPAAILLPTTVGFAMLGVLYLFVYSYLVWRDDPERIPPAGTLPAN